MKTLYVTEEKLNRLVIEGLKQGHTMQEVHKVLDQMKVVILKGGE